MGLRKYIGVGALVLASMASCVRGEENVDINQPRVLEFDYKEDDKEKYIFKVKASFSVSGAVSGGANLELNGNLSSEVYRSTNESASLEFKVTRFKGNMRGKVKNEDVSYDLNWKEGDSRVDLPDGFDLEESGRVIFERGGEIKSLSSSFGVSSRLDIFPDRPVKKGDSWEYNNDEGVYNFKLEGERECGGRKCFVISYSAKREGRDEESSISGKGSGKIYYDPVGKGMVGFDVDCAAEQSASVEIEDDNGDAKKKKITQKSKSSISLMKE